jgi:hypothetical protein
MEAYAFAECAYQGITFANENINSVTAMNALNSAQEIHNSPVYQSHFDDPDRGWEAMINKAKLGDYSLFNQTYQTDCVN